jgi:glycosyltransferase involved in cell wall biosynthesis
MQRPVRVAFVTYSMHFGGMEALLLRLGNYLRLHGCDVEAVTTVEPGEWFSRWSEVQIKATHVKGYDRRSFLVPWLHSQRVASALTERDYDVLFLNHSRHAQASLAQLPENVIVIPILHNDKDEIYDVGCANPDAWNVAVGVSPKVAETARRRVPHRPVVQLWSGVDLPSEELRQRRQALRAPIGLLFVGRLEHAQKGIFWLPDIYRACLELGVDATLTIVGDGPDAGELQRRLAEKGLLEKTRLLKGLTPDQVYTLLTEAHVLIMPSLYEGLPIVLLESQACGCVPVVSKLAGITDVAVEEGETGVLVDVGDTGGFAEAVAALCRDPARWDRMSRAGKARVRDRFSVDTMGKAYLELVTDAVSGRYPLPRPRASRRKIDLSVFSWKDFLPLSVRQLIRRGRARLASIAAPRRTAIPPR